MCKLSIIVPVYNTGKYFKRCIDSILEQATEEVEILVINDGSTDDSKIVIEEYVKNKEGNIRVFNKKNTGIADTRNFGISKAKGKYILFVDSDDYIKSDLITKLLDYTNDDVDIVKFKLVKVRENGEEIEKIDGAIFDKVDGQTAFNNLCFSDVLLDSPCVYMFKKELFIKNNFKFKINTEHEDFGLIPLVILKAQSMVSINTYGYCYIQTNQSITRNEDYSKTLKRFNDLLLHYDNMIEFINSEKLTPNTMKNIKTYYTNAIIMKLKEINKKDLDVYIQKIKTRKMINNIQITNVKQLIKKFLLLLNIKWYLKLK